ncbi:MAG: hypothetical protein RBS56_02100 [Candidatus Gracilibacteria bacterium]|jgi:hypothetical protein|nr:hypothetical protein [Candidatus Gracilibacteria bacterium]
MQIKQTLKKHFKKITAASLLTVLGILHLIFNIPLTIKNLFEDISAKKISIQNDIDNRGGKIETLITTPEEVNLYGIEPPIPEEENFYYKIYENYKNQGNDIIEVRPKQGRWYPFIIAIPYEEIEKVGIKQEYGDQKYSLTVTHGPSGKPPIIGTFCTQSRPTIREDKISEDKKWWILTNDCQATPEESFYIRYKSQPSILYYGQENGPIYQITK